MGKFLRFYRSDPTSTITNRVHHTEVEYTGDGAVEAARIKLEYKNDPFFRWYEPLELQLEGRH